MVFGELRGYVAYRTFDGFCGICDVPITVTREEQKYLLEVKRVPVKMLMRGALYCGSCRTRRARINNLKRIDGTKTTHEVRAELARLGAEEEALRARSRHRYESAKWPYPFRS